MGRGNLFFRVFHLYPAHLFFINFLNMRQKAKRAHHPHSLLFYNAIFLMKFRHVVRKIRMCDEITVETSIN